MITDRYLHLHHRDYIPTTFSQVIFTFAVVKMCRKYTDSYYILKLWKHFKVAEPLSVGTNIPVHNCIAW